VRFQSFIGVEAVLTKGPVTVDRQAIGSLRDYFGRELIPDAMWPSIAAAIPPATAENFCALFASTDHLAGVTTLSARVLEVARGADAIGNLDPKVIACTRTGTTVVFDKEAGLGPGAGRRRVYGAIRFLPAPYSSFQIVGFGMAPTPERLADMKTLVESLVVKAATTLAVYRRKKANAQPSAKPTIHTSRTEPMPMEVEPRPPSFAFHIRRSGTNKTATVQRIAAAVPVPIPMKTIFR